MTNKAKNFCNVCSLLLLAAGAVISATSVANSLLAARPYLREITFGIYFFSVAGCVVLLRYFFSDNTRYLLVSFVAALAMILCRIGQPLAGTKQEIGSQIGVFLFYYFLIVLSSIVLKFNQLITVAASVIIAELGHAAYLSLQQGGFDTSEFVVRLRLLVPYLFVFCSVGAIASAVTNIQKEKIVSSKHDAPPPTPSDIAVKTDSAVIHVSASLPADKTQSFKINYAGELLNTVDTELEELLQSVVYFMGKNFGAYSSLGFLYNPRQRCFTLNSFYSRSSNIRRGICVPLGEGIIGRIGTEGHSFMSGDLMLYSRDIPYYATYEPVNSIIAVPIVSYEKELLGALVIDSKNKNVFNDQHKETMKRFSRLAAALISNARRRIFQQKAALHFRVLYEASQQLSTVLATLEVFNILDQMVSSLVNAKRIITILFDHRKKTLFIYKILGDPMELKEKLEFPLNQGIYSYVLKTRNIVNIGDFQTAQKTYYRFVPDEPKNALIQSLIAIPFIDEEARAIGLLSVESEQADFFHSETEQILSTLVFNASIAFSKALLYQKLELLATTDGLTGLNNHRCFQQLLAQEISRSSRYSRCFSLLLMDIDYFKKFNDTYGHPVGDLVLKEIANCIRQSIRINDIAARYGGEEFAVIIPETDCSGTKIIAERIRYTIESHVIQSLGRELHVTVSIGYANYPKHATKQTDLIDCADIALYHSKETGRNKVTEYENGMKKSKK